MKRLIRDIRDEIDATPGGSAWMFGVHCYVVDILSGYIDGRGLTIWDEAERIGKITEEDLLNGAKDWRQYSRTGNSLIYNRDICYRLCGRKDLERTREGEFLPNDHEDWLDLQAKALQQAAQIVIKTINCHKEGE